MGKAKRGRKKPKVPNPIDSSASTIQEAHRQAEVGSGDHAHVCAKETEIQTVIEQLGSSTIEDKIFGLHSLATIFEDPEAVGDVIRHKIVKVAGPLLVERSSFVRNAAAGALRNLSACGSHEICDLLVEQDVMTPLVALIRQYASEWQPSPKKKEGKVEEQVDTFVQAVHLLWNLCESNSRALKYFNDCNLLPILVKCLDSNTFGVDVATAVAHCLYTVSEDNAPVIKQLKESETQIQNLINLELHAYSTLLLRTLSCGLLMNLNGGKVVGLAPPTAVLIMKCLSDTLNVDQRLALNALTSNLPMEQDEPALILEKMEGINDVRYLLEAQQTALEILTNLCSDDVDLDDDMDQDLSDTSDEIFSDGCMADEGPSTSEKFSVSVTPEVHEAVVSGQLVDRVWEKTVMPPENVCLMLKEHKDGKLLFNKVSTVRCRAFLCLNNLISGLDLEDVGGASNLYRMWGDIGTLIFKHVTADDTQLLEAATSAMRAALQRLADVKTNLFGQLPATDLQLMFNGVQQCVDANVRANLIRSVGMIGMIITGSAEENSQLLLRNIGKFLLDVSLKEAELWVVAEALDTVMDVFGEDETDAAAADINLVDKLNAILPSLKHKVRLQRKTLGEHYLVVTTVNTNLSRFIKYKSDRLAPPPQNREYENGHKNGHML